MDADSLSFGGEYITLPLCFVGTETLKNADLSIYGYMYDESAFSLY